MSLRSPHEPADNFVVPERKPAKPPETKPDTWRPHTTPGFEVNRDGRLRTNTPERKASRMRGLGRTNRCLTELGEEKRCPQCGSWWPLDPEFFMRNRARPDGFSSECKACMASHQDEVRGVLMNVPPPIPDVLRLVLRPGAAG